jgi:hypothetical protein
MLAGFYCVNRVYLLEYNVFLPITRGPRQGLHLDMVRVEQEASKHHYLRGRSI